MDIFFNNNDRNEFYSKIQENIKDYLPEEYAGADVRVRDVLKNNDTVMNALTLIIPGEKLAPTIYLNQVYEKHLEGCPDEEIMKKIAETIMKAQVPEDIDVNMMLDYEMLKRKLMVQICDYEKNKILLQSLPHTINGDFAVFYRVMLSAGDDEFKSSVVTNGLLDSWGISIEQLHTDAMASEYSNQTVLRSMDDITVEIITGQEGVGIKNILDLNDYYEVPYSIMYVLTNKYQYLGAAAIANKDVMKKIGQLLNNDYYVLPSSIHETIIVPKEEDMDAEHFIRMVQNVNHDEVEEMEILSDKVQFFDRKSGILQNAWDYEHPAESHIRKQSQRRKQDKGSDFAR